MVARFEGLEAQKMKKPEDQYQIGELVLYAEEGVYATVDGYLWLESVNQLPRIAGYRLSCGVTVPREAILRYGYER